MTDSIYIYTIVQSLFSKVFFAPESRCQEKKNKLKYKNQLRDVDVSLSMYIIKYFGPEAYVKVNILSWVGLSQFLDTMDFYGSIIIWRLAWYNGSRIFLFPFIYPSLPVAHLNDAPRRLSVVTGDSARIHDETYESSAWFCNVLDV